jgi:hypothetical protein
MRVRYEDLCCDPDRTMTAVFEFCDVHTYRVTAAPVSQDHHIVGNRMRLRSVREISLDEAWRSTLTTDELECAASLAGHLHERYGYPPMSTTDLSGDPVSSYAAEGLRDRAIGQ